MIFNTFDDTDIVSGRITRVASGFWPGGVTNWSQSLFVDDFWDLTGSIATPSPAYGATLYDVRRTMYYVNVFPNSTEHSNHNPFLSATYGHVGGSGSFLNETASIRANPTKAIYTQFRNMLLGTADLNGLFTFETGSSAGTVDALDIFVMSFSTYKMKDRVDEGLLQISLSGSNGLFTFIDDSSTQTQVGTVYNLISGSLATGIAAGATYQGIGLFYPANGIVVFSAAQLDSVVGLKNANFNSDGGGPYNYNSSSFATEYGQNHKVIFESLKYGGASGTGNLNSQISVRKSEYVPARHYFVRVKNRDFNYSNNPTYVFDGTDGVHAQGTIRNSDFISDPRTYVTTVGLYNDSNELVAVAKLSRPALKSFDNELLIKCRLDF
jgi:hypothetical protein